MKNILAIAPYSFLPSHSGGQKYISGFLHHLGKYSHLHVVSVAENDFSQATSFKAHPILKKKFSRYLDRSLINTLTKLIEIEKISILVCEHPYFAWLAFAVRKRTGVKVLIHAHNIEYQRFRSTGKWWWPILKSYEKKAFIKADALLFISPEDSLFARDQWNIPQEKCLDLPYGIETPEFPGDKSICGDILRSRYGVTKSEKLFLFAGLLSYQPNADALSAILEKINPVLLQHPDLKYKILICGKGLADSFGQLQDYKNKNIIYSGFVDDIETYYKGSDLFLNPVLSGGGVKTKVIEAIGAGTTVISTESGALGLNKEACTGKLFISPDNNWDQFAESVIQNRSNDLPTQDIFYKTYNWEKIIEQLISDLPDQPAG